MDNIVVPLGREQGKENSSLMHNLMQQQSLKLWSVRPTSATASLLRSLYRTTFLHAVHQPPLLGVRRDSVDTCEFRARNCTSEKLGPDELVGDQRGRAKESERSIRREEGKSSPWSSVRREQPKRSLSSSLFSSQNKRSRGSAENDDDHTYAY